MSMQSKRRWKVFALGVSAVLVSACQRVGPTENGVIFRELPPALGGGLAKRVISQDQKVMLMPWEKLYRIDTSQHAISWGGEAHGSGQRKEFVYTRSSDGNEVALKMTVRYQVSSDPNRLMKLVQEVATSDQAVEELVATVARADIRTFMSELQTAEFADVERRYQAADNVKKSMNSRLEPYGIEVLAVTPDGFQFERLRRDGTPDSSYQDLLTKAQELVEQTKRENARISTVQAAKEREFQEEMAHYFERVQQANGEAAQARIRGDSYFTTRGNEAKAITAQGEAEVKGLIEQINALNGPGGQAIVKMDLVRALLRENPKFVVMNDPAGKNGIDVRRVDANDLLTQLGVFEALRDRTPKAAVKATPKGTSTAPQSAAQERNMQQKNAVQREHESSETH